MIKINRVTKFKQKAFKAIYWYAYRATKNPKNGFEKDFSKLMNSSVFVIFMDNLRKYRDITLVTTDERRVYLALGSNYYTAIYFSENLIAVEMRTEAEMNNPIHLVLLMLDISKIPIY